MRYGNMINLGLHLLFAKITRKRVPFQVHIRVLEQCNQQCSYCVGDYPRRTLEPPSTRQLLALIDSLARLRTRRITLFGGEPFLRNDIYDIVRRIKYHKIDCSLTTNGRLVDRHKHVLKDLDQLSISLDGDRANHDAYRGEGSWNAAIHAIKLARSMGVPVQLMCTLTRLTDHKLTSLLAVAEQYDCSVDVDLLHPIFNADGTTTLRPEDAGNTAIKTLLSYQINSQNSRLVHHPYILKYIRDWPLPCIAFRLFRRQVPVGFKPIYCYAGRFSALIESNGDLLPCCVNRPDYHPLNVFEVGVEEAWRKMPINNCITCRSIGYNTLNALFALHPASVLSFLGREIKTRFQRICCKV